MSKSLNLATTGVNVDIMDKIRSKIQMEKKNGRNLWIDCIRLVVESNKELHTHTVGRP